MPSTTGTTNTSWSGAWTDGIGSPLWSGNGNRAPVSPIETEAVQAAFRAFTAKLPQGTVCLHLNQQDFERLQDKLISHGFCDLLGRPLWYSIPIESRSDVPQGKVRFVKGY